VQVHRLTGLDACLLKILRSAGGLSEKLKMIRRASYDLISKMSRVKQNLNPYFRIV
jgi:hypothetical protein